MTEYTYLHDADELKNFYALLASGPSHVVVDTETDGLFPYQGNRIVGSSWYFPDQDIACYIPIRHEGDPLNVDPVAFFRDLGRVYPHPDTTYVFFNSKFDLHMFSVDGMRDPEQIEDVMVAAHIANENEGLGIKDGAYKLKRLAVKYLGAWAGEGEGDLEAAAKARGLNPKSEMWRMPGAEVSYYAQMDVVITWELRQFYMNVLERWNQVELYEMSNEALLKAYLRMERNGIYVSEDLIRQHMREVEPQLEAVRSRIQEISREAGGLPNLNPGSSQQLKGLFKLLGHDLASTDADAMTLLEEDGSELAGLVLKYRHLSKAIGSFYMPYLSMRDENGYLHPSFNMTNTVTGRMSSSKPNFQQVPKKKKGNLREIFRPTPGYVFIQLDYKNLEVFLIAYFAKAMELREILRNNGDQHSITAAKMTAELNRPISRDEGKKYNFSLQYGMGAGPKGAQKKLHMTEAQAKEIVGAWRKVNHELRTAYFAAQKLAKTLRNPDGSLGGKFQFIRIMDGRTRKFHPYTQAGLPAPCHNALSFIIQGTAARVTEGSVLRVCKTFPDNNIVRPIGPIHDALMLELREDHLHLIPQIKQLMEDWPEFDPPLKVEIEFSDVSWLHMTPIADYQDVLSQQQVRELLKVIETGETQQ